MQPRILARGTVLVAVVFALAVVALAPAMPAAAAADLSFDVRFSGVVQTLGSADTAWVIGSQTLDTDEDTQIIENTTPAVGVWAEVVAKKQTDGSLLARQITLRPEQPRLRGPLQSKPEGNVGDWVIAGVTVKVTAETKLAARGLEIKVGGWVEAVMEEAAGVLTAKNIIGTGAADAVIASGELQEFTGTEWVISSMALRVDPSEDGTLISGKPVLGLIVHAAAQLEEDNSLTAQTLRVSWIDQNSLAPLVEFRGKIEKLPVTGLRGEWVVDGKTVLVMPNARIHQEKGLAVVGATVHVSGWQVPEKVIAAEITVLSSPEEGGTYTRFMGWIQSLPAEGVIGAWVVGDQAVTVTARTQIIGGTPEVGRLAGVEGIKRADNSVMATSIRVRRAPLAVPAARQPRALSPE